MAYGPKQTLEEGYNKFVIKNEEGCWDWSGCCPENPGYGQFRHGTKKERAHRASWIIHNGPIPEGMCVCHHCDNKRCSNPEHLFLGTKKDNNLDALKKGIATTIGKVGVENHMAKLTEEQVKEIRIELKKREGLSKKEITRNGLSQKKLAEKYGVCQVLISRIKLGKAWKTPNKLNVTS